MENTLLYSWNYHDSKNRGTLWYIIALSIAIGLVIWGFLTSQYGMSIVVMIVSGLFYFLEINSDEQVQVEIAQTGIKVQNSFYEYGKIINYCLIYSGENAVYLKLNLKKNTVKVLQIRIDNTVVPHLQEILPNYIEESEKQDLGTLDSLSDYLKL